MFRAIAILASIVGASAFAPASRMVIRSSALKMNFENEIGAQAPLGFWDPLNFLEGADQARFDRLREVEIKHGRISMLAILGDLLIIISNNQINIVISMIITYFQATLSPLLA